MALVVEKRIGCVVLENTCNTFSQILCKKQPLQTVLSLLLCFNLGEFIFHFNFGENWMNMKVLVVCTEYDAVRCFSHSESQLGR